MVYVASRGVVSGWELDVLESFRRWGVAATKLYGEDVQVGGVSGAEEFKILARNLMELHWARQQLRVRLEVWATLNGSRWGVCCWRPECPSVGVPAGEGSVCSEQHFADLEAELEG